MQQLQRYEIVTNGHNESQLQEYNLKDVHDLSNITNLTKNISNNKVYN